MLCDVKFYMTMLPDAVTLERHRAAIRARLHAAGTVRPGPGTISWTLNREVLVVAGWGRAILLQLAHPLVAAGVDDHSRFRAGLMTRIGRLRSTVNAMRSLTFGGDEEAIAVAARINTIHDRVFGSLRAAAGSFPTGTPYSAHDADLLRWVHATLVDSIPRVYEALIGPLTPEERDRYCAEAAVMEPLLDIPAGELPRTTAALDAYMHEMFASGRIAVTGRSRALARAVLFPPGWRLLWPMFRPAQLITIGLLPAAIRDAYGFTWTALRVSAALMPAVVRQWPAARRQSRARRGASESRESFTAA
jgi:uncharacterized protein (DUF2236 family)